MATRSPALPLQHRFRDKQVKESPGKAEPESSQGFPVIAHLSALLGINPNESIISHERNPVGASGGGILVKDAGGLCREFRAVVGLLRLPEAEFADRHVEVYIGWPMSSWMDRFAIGVMLFNMMRLPRLFPAFGFFIRYTTSVSLPPAMIKPDETAGEEAGKQGTSDS